MKYRAAVIVLGQPGSVLVTGDLALARKPPPGSDVLAPREFVLSLASG